MLRKYESQIVLAIFAFCLLGFAFQTGRSTQHQEDRKQIETAYKSSKAAQNQKRANESDLRPYEPANPKAENRSGETQEVTFFGLRLGEGLLVFVTVWLVLVTKSLVNGSKETAERQLRAYVHIANVRISEMNSGNNPKIEVIVRNYGQTPAIKITNTYNCREMSRPTEEDFSLDKLQTVELPDLAPRAQAHSTTNYPFPSWGPIKPLLLNKKAIFYVWGRIDYCEVFGQQRWTEYRFRLAIGSVSGIPDDDSLVIDSRAGNITT